MKIRNIIESIYDGLEDSDEFADPHAEYEPHDGLRYSIQNGTLTGNLRPNITIQKFTSQPHERPIVSDIFGRGAYKFTIHNDFVDDVTTLLDSGDSEWASLFLWEIRAAIINTLLRAAGKDEDTEDDWRMDMKVLESSLDTDAGNEVEMIVHFK